MAKEIQHKLSKPKAQAVGSPAQPNTPFTTPPPAKPLPGITGRPPLPVGGLVRQPSGVVKPRAGYTEAELATLETIPGWSAEQGVPDNLAEVLGAIQSEVQATIDPDNLQAPVALDTPPLHVPAPLDVSKLPEADRQRVLESIAAATAAREQTKKRNEQGIQQLHPGATAINEMLAGNVRELELDDDRVESQEAVATPTVASEAGRTGVGAPVHRNCPHCQWPLDQPAIPEPDWTDKFNYQQCMASAGAVLFQKEYSLYGRQLVVVFRELRLEEVDMCWKQARLDHPSGPTFSEADFLETLQRYLLSLHLVSVTTPQTSHKYPTSLTDWGVDDLDLAPTETAMPQILAKVQQTMPSASLFRAIGGKLSQFNRLVAKMEASAENENFWKQTE